MVTKMMVMTKNRMIVVLSICYVVIFTALGFLKAAYFPVIYPIRSSSQTLYVVLFAGYIQPNRPVITLKHYIDSQHVADYVLTIEHGIRPQEPQTYSLPQIKEGAVEVNVEIGDSLNRSTLTTYYHANDLYNRGLLIYLNTDFSDYSVVDGKVVREQYIILVSGKDTRSYVNEIYSLGWSLMTSNPKLERIPLDVTPYLVTYSRWKENEWVVTHAGDAEDNICCAA